MFNFELDFGVTTLKVLYFFIVFVECFLRQQPLESNSTDVSENKQNCIVNKQRFFLQNLPPIAPKFLSQYSTKSRFVTETTVSGFILRSLWPEQLQFPKNKFAKKCK